MQTKAQIWVETVVYTLIGIAIIGAVLAIITPKINEIKDKNVIEQSLGMLNDFDTFILEARQASGNVRVLQIVIKRGDVEIDAENEKISWTIEDSNYVYSQPGEIVEVGNIKALTTEKGKKATVKLELDYNQLDLKFNGEDEKKQLTSAPTPYKLSITNEGSSAGKTIINIKEIS